MHSQPHRLALLPAPLPPAAAPVLWRKRGLRAMYNNGAATATGGSALTAPLWFQFIDPLFQFLIAALGLVVLVLTVWNKALEIKLKRRALNATEEPAHGPSPQD